MEEGIIMNNEVIKFIETFQNNSNTDDKSFWFSFILHRRFQDSVIMYDPKANHFGTKIGNVIYDHTGDVTEKYNWKDWEMYSSPKVEYQSA